MPTRRHFLATSALALAAQRLLHAQAPVTRPNLALVDRDRIVAAAARALGRTAPLTLLDFTLDLPALAAAHLLLPQETGYPVRAAVLLESWFVAPATRLAPAPTLASPAALIDRATLAEVAVALPFLPLEPSLAEAIQTWFRQSVAWLTSDRTALLARDARDRHASSWLLQATAQAHYLHDEATLTDCRHRFQTATLRAQISPAGLFPHELTTEAPLRNSLLNLDLLAGAVHLLSTPFDSLWERELQDGPGMRVAIARHAAYIAQPRTWPYPADLEHFHDLPGRRPALVFAARAYAQADYATLWSNLNPDPTPLELLNAFPIRQPILWLQQPRRQF